MIHTDTATAIINQAKAAGNTVTLSVRAKHSDGVLTDMTGDPISVNSKGVNLRVDGNVRSFGLSRIDSITENTLDADGYTTADLADMFNIAAKDLRVTLRALGMGVGKGRRYALTDSDLTAVRDALAG